ncbi:MAG TPA: hypothetical protein VN829_16420, partial [Dongiaceae bacterium]|nr:hypothetical protein [Dongiaceae bacterium]
RLPLASSAPLLRATILALVSWSGWLAFPVIGCAQGYTFAAHLRGSQETKTKPETKTRKERNETNS